MTVKVQISDSAMIKNPLAKMGEAERELLRVRVDQAADALQATGNPEFADLVAVRLLERRGAVSEGSVEKAINSAEKQEEMPKGSSIFATMGVGRKGY